MAKNLEPIYDEEIAPLMAKIIKICKDNDIPLVASFQLTDEDDHLACSTILIPEWSHKKFKMAYKVLREDWEAVSPVQAFTITTRPKPL